MKKLYATTLSILLASGLSFSQQIPGADFENWTISGSLSPDGEYPVDWSTVNNTVPNSQAWLLNETCFREDTDVFGGSYSCRLETVAPPLAGFPNVNGIVTNGTINETSYAVEDGVNYTFRPDSLVGWYKASPMGTDFATIEMVLKNSTEDTLGWARFEAPNTMVSSYTRFSVPFVYTSTASPSKAAVLLSSSDGFNSVVGSVLWVDDLEVVINPVGIEENVDISNVGAFSANGYVHMNNSMTDYNLNYELIGLSGKLIESGQLPARSKKNIQPSIESGLYFLRFNYQGIQKTVKLYFAE